jgi:hypothetical protein
MSLRKRTRSVLVKVCVCATVSRLILFDLKSSLKDKVRIGRVNRPILTFRFDRASRANGEERGREDARRNKKTNKSLKFKSMGRSRTKQDEGRARSFVCCLIKESAQDVCFAVFGTAFFGSYVSAEVTNKESS